MKSSWSMTAQPTTAPAQRSSGGWRKSARSCCVRKANGGQSAARNFAVARSTIALIALLDQDDNWYPTHIEVLRSVFEKHQGMSLGWDAAKMPRISSEAMP
jgi:Glycosyl transferase family 2